jgi:Uma2 family endonuclease
MAETDDHRNLMLDLISGLQHHYAADPLVYVSGNLLLFYESGNKRRHVSPDVFVVKGVRKHTRPNYLLWEEGRGPDVVIELTSSSTRSEDTDKKFALYRDVLRVAEYFMFDPHGDYLKPPLQGYRLRAEAYQPLRAVGGRIRSKVLGLELVCDGKYLHLVDPVTGGRMPAPLEAAELAQEAYRQAEAARERAEAARQEEALARQQAETARQQEALARQQEALARQEAETALQQEALARQQAEAELERLRRQIEEQRRRRGEA